MSGKKDEHQRELEALNAFLEGPEVKLSGLRPEMVYDIAAGLEEPEEVAQRYGFEGEDWEKIKSNKAFQVSLSAAVAELEQNGVTFKNKSKLMASELMEHAFRMAKAGDMSPGMLLKLIEMLAKYAGFEPKNEPQAANTGPSFSININVPPDTPAPTIDVTPAQPTIEAS